MRVLLVNKFHWRKGGSETYYFSLAEGLRELGHEVFFFSMQDERNEPCTESEFFVTNRDYSGSSSPLRKVSAAASLIYSPEAKRKFQALCEKVRPDVVHLNLVHRQITLSILDAPYLKKHHVPVVMTLHDCILVCPSYLMIDGEGRRCNECLDGKFRHCVERRCVKGSRSKSLLAAAEARFLRMHDSYEKVDRFVVPSRFMEGVLIRGGFVSGKIQVLRNFLPFPMNQNDALNSTMTGTGETGSPYVLFLGRLSSEKGPDVLLKAFSLCVEKLGDLNVVFAGDGPMRAELERSVPSELSSRVSFTGYLRGDALRSLIKGASFVVVPSRCYENFPYSILEAFSFGVPVIGSELGGIPELVVEGSTGFLCKPDDPSSLADALTRSRHMLLASLSYDDMREKCRDLVRCTCDKNRYLTSLTDLYEALILERGVHGD